MAQSKQIAALLRAPMSPAALKKVSGGAKNDTPALQQPLNKAAEGQVPAR
jgi:hypothetical protein